MIQLLNAIQFFLNPFKAPFILPVSAAPLNVTNSRRCIVVLCIGWSALNCVCHFVDYKKKGNRRFCRDTANFSMKSDKNLPIAVFSTLALFCYNFLIHSFWPWNNQNHEFADWIKVSLFEKTKAALQNWVSLLLWSSIFFSFQLKISLFVECNSVTHDVLAVTVRLKLQLLHNRMIYKTDVMSAN